MFKPYTRYYTVSSRPVKIVQLDDGGAQCLAFDFVTGGFVYDPRYLSRIQASGSENEVEEFTETQFEQIVVLLRQLISETRQATRIVWKHTGDAEFPYQAEINGRTFTVRINDFPDEPLYTLLAGEMEIEDLEDWPPAWVSPETPQALLNMLERTRRAPIEDTRGETLPDE